MAKKGFWIDWKRKETFWSIKTGKYQKNDYFLHLGYCNNKFFVIFENIISMERKCLEKFMERIFIMDRGIFFNLQHYSTRTRITRIAKVKLLIFSKKKNHFRTFANLIHHLDDKLVYIPLVLLLGFFVTFVVDRWKNIFINMGFIDNVAFTVSNYITGSEESVVIARRNILRYLCASQVLVLRDISLKVRKRFPNMTSLLQAGESIINNWKNKRI